VIASIAGAVRRERIILALIVAVACGLRLAYLGELSSDLFFHHPIIDARLNVEDARYLREVSWLGPPEPYWKPPLYAYVLALLGDGAWLPRLLNVALDAASLVLVAGLGRRFFSARVGLAAAAVLALEGALVYFTGELVSASLTACLLLLAVRAAVWAWDAPPGARAPLRWLGAGAACGLLALARAEGLLLLPAVALAASWRRPRRLGLAAAALAGGVLVVAPVTARNAARGGDAVLVSANGGINFYIGAAPEHHGMVGVRPGPDWERLIREPESAGILRSGARASGWYTRAALARMADAPGEAAAHLARKVALVWYGWEAPSNRDLYHTRRASTVLAALLWDAPPLYLPFGLLAPLALAGAALVVRRRHRAWPLVALVALLTATTAAFFVTARFRAPMVPFVALLAAFAAGEAAAAWRAGRRRELVRAAAGALALAVACNWPGAFAAGRAHYARRIDAEEHFFRGTVLFAEAGRPAEAEVELERAAELEPRSAQTLLNLAQARLARGNAAGAADAVLEFLAVVDGASPGERAYEGDAMAVLARALADPALAATPLGRGGACVLAGDWACAVPALEAAGPAARPLLGRALLARAVATWETAPEATLADLTLARLLRPGDAETHLVAAATFERLGMTREACDAAFAFLDTEWPRGTLYRRLLSSPAPGALDLTAATVALRCLPHDARTRELGRRLSARPR
jgi:4-amino-4-deoxy-L-arabinose transferase-like glycosyltransferase